ncbi:MAG TPA: hypothetical protein VKO18_15860 [Terriglobia bacterium]|nr:hypothetical protein [Terriglobia bacterium]
MIRVVEEGEIAKVMGTDLQSIFSGFLKLGLLAGVALYTGLVVMSYRTDGPRVRPVVDWHDPAHSAEHLAVWLGVISLALAVRVATKVFGMLSEASAEVGEWFLSRRRDESQ